MRYLFIIGNGFDLAHGLKTSYTHLFEEKSILHNLRKNNFIHLIRMAKTSNNWCDFEYQYYQILTHFNDRNFFFNTFGNEGKIYNSSAELNEEFSEVEQFLVNHLKNEQNKFKPIDHFEFMFELFNTERTMVLNFNYTTTVSQYLSHYKKINYVQIHGEIENENNPIIFGFAANEMQSKELAAYNDYEMLKRIKRMNYKLSSNEENVKNWLADNKGSLIVIVLGHSCGLSDLLILSEIFNQENLLHIIPFYFSNSEGYKKLNSNIFRIFTESNTFNNGNYSKLNSIDKCCKIPQHDSTGEEVTLFKEKCHKILSIKDPKLNSFGRPM